MTFNRKKTILLLAGIFCFLGFLLFITYTYAATSTIKGKAYWEQYEYIYFHCSDDQIGNRLDENQNLLGGNRYVSPPAEEGFHFYIEPCTENEHSVYIDENGVLSGSAWNPSFGTISFEYDGVNEPPDGFGFANSRCEDSCNPSTNCIACYVFADQTLYGWGHIKETNEWIKLHAYPSTPVQIYTDDNNPLYPGTYLELGDFAGTASSTSPYPDISFNCETEVGGNTCASRDYKVYIKNLILGRLEAPNWTYTNACNSRDALQAILRWDKLSGTQNGYEIIINDSDNLSTSTGEYVCWFYRPSGGGTTQQIVSGDFSSDCPNGLEYDQAYYWWLRGYDEEDKPTAWTQYESNSSADTDQNLDNNSKTFETFKHEFPHPFFTWEPENIEEIITSTSTTFTSQSFAYSSVAPETPIDCNVNPSACAAYLWETSDPLAIISSSTESVTDISFYSATNTTIALTVSDPSGYYCGTSTVLKINYDLPLWREVKAEQFN